MSSEYLQNICNKLFSSRVRETTDFSRPGTAGRLLRESVIPSSQPSSVLYTFYLSGTRFANVLFVVGQIPVLGNLEHMLQVYSLHKVKYQYLGIMYQYKDLSLRCKYQHRHQYLALGYQYQDNSTSHSSTSTTATNVRMSTST